MSGDIVVHGTRLTPPQAAEYERRLRGKPEDLVLRGALVAYYARRGFLEPTLRRRLQAHVLWLIAHRPEVEVLRSPPAFLDPTLDGTAYRRARRLWHTQERRYPRNLAVIENAAHFFEHHDRRATERLYRRALALDPRDPHWHERLAFFYRLGAHFRGRAELRRAAGRSLGHFRQALALRPALADKDTFVKSAAWVALEAGQPALARRWAERLLRWAGRRENRRDNAEALHHGHALLGVLALARGDRREARRRLLLSANVHGSAVLGSFGPDMRLAERLLVPGRGGDDASDRETVARFLDRCGRFWETGRPRLRAWARELAAGGTPDLSRRV